MVTSEYSRAFILLDLLRHISQKCSLIHKVSTPLFVLSDKKSLPNLNASNTQRLPEKIKKQSGFFNFRSVKWLIDKSVHIALLAKQFSQKDSSACRAS